MWLEKFFGLVNLKNWSKIANYEISKSVLVALAIMLVSLPSILMPVLLVNLFV